MSATQFASIVRARWRIIALVLLLSLVSAAAVAVFMPRQYTASAAMVIDTPPDPVALMMNMGGVSPAFMATQADVIQSERVAQRVARNLQLTTNPQIREAWFDATDGKGAIDDWLTGFLRTNIEAKPSRDSNVVAVSYIDRDPRFAADVANAFVQAYIDTSVEMRVDPARQYGAFVDSRMKEAREALEASQSKLSAYQKEKGMTTSDERLDVESARLSELSTQLVMIQALASESSSRQAQARGSADRMQEVLNNPFVADLKADVSRGEARMQELNARLGDNHPQVVESRAHLNELRSRLETESRRVVGSLSVNNSINRQREGDIRSALEAQRAKVLRLKTVRDEGSMLVRDVDNAQRAFEAVTSRLSQASLAGQTAQSSTYMLNRASPPLTPSSPRLGQIARIAAVAGLLLAVGAALLLEWLDRRVRSGDEVVASLGLAVLGTLPKPVPRRLLGRDRIPLMKQRLLRQLPPAGRSI